MFGTSRQPFQLIECKLTFANVTSGIVRTYKHFRLIQFALSNPNALWFVAYGYEPCPFSPTGCVNGVFGRESFRVSRSLLDTECVVIDS